MFEIRFISKENIKSIIPLVALLNPDTSEKILLERLDVMMKNDYKCLGVYDREKLIGVCGLWSLMKFYNGRHLEPDNVVILPEYRSKGVGEQMMAWIDKYAEENNYEVIELNAYVENLKGVEFWKKAGYFIRGHHFQKAVKKK
jgi:GNAT superfamily N-acetyltransferase